MLFPFQELALELKAEITKVLQGRNISTFRIAPAKVGEIANMVQKAVEPD